MVARTRVAIVGCGLIGDKRAHALGDAHLVAAADVDRSRAEALARGFEGCVATDRWQAVVKRTDVDIVIVATTNEWLAPVALGAVEQGKHVLVEKPAARRAAELAPVVEAAQTAGVVVKVGFNHRFHPALQKAHEIFAAGTVGPLMYVRARYGHGGRLGYDREWRADPRIAGGGELLDQGIHLIDLARWFAGDFTDVQGHVATWFWDMPVEDNAFLCLKTAEGQVAWLHASWTEWKNVFSFEVMGRTGKLQIDGLGGSYGVERLTLYQMRPELGPPETTSWEYPRGDDSWKLEFDHLRDCIAHGRVPSGSIEDAMAALAIVDRVRGPPMIITRSPLRVSLGGGGTDLPSYYRRHTGFLIAAAIDKYVYITLHQTFVEELIVKYSKLERVTSVDEIQHPIIREALREVGVDGRYLELTSMADIPAGTGLGSSGSFTTALLKALHAHRKNLVHPRELAEQACTIEIDRLGEPIGKQDAYIASFGGITCFHYLPNDTVEAAPLKLETETLYNFEDNLLLFFTGYSRSASSILREQDDRSKEHEQRMLDNLHFVKDLGFQSKEALEAGNLRKFAELMNVHWLYKKERSGSMTNTDIDRWYDVAMANGALGGKLIGAGGGGFLMFYSEDKGRLRHAMTDLGLREVRFRFDFEGTKVVAQ